MYQQLDLFSAVVDNEGGMPLEDYYSVAEAARVLRVSRDAIHKAIKKKLLRAERHGNMFFIHKDELARYRQEKRSPGRPREKRKYQRRSE